MPLFASQTRLVLSSLAVARRDPSALKALMHDPKRTYLLPVRVWAETDYGIVVALASQVKLDGQALNHGS